MVTSGLEVAALGPSDCWERLRGAPIARIGITVGALPVILPIFFRVVDRSIVFRSSPGSKLAAATSGSVVAVEVDQVDPDSAEGWSVLVQGLAREVTDHGETNRLDALDLPSVSVTDDGNRFVAVDVATITGRRLRRQLLA